MKLLIRYMLPTSQKTVSNHVFGQNKSVSENIKAFQRDKHYDCPRDMSKSQVNVLSS